MDYSIKQVAARTNLPASTLRYYDKSGLMPLLKKTEYGTRKYSEMDICWLELVCCLKDSGMSLDDIKAFMLLCLEGSSTSEQRREMLEQHRSSILKQIEVLNCSLGTINYKLEHYNEIGIFHIDTK
ncbi:MerR family transcriptional regulator [Paenibacillus oryzae]|jgi:DNA-binding transcriptional MerR regulator|uniref:MerR family transcriptional regulator n=1 Tax=Paenibacillus oryzae TaxID=1844972 RepID=A0A1A5YF07_9BACL|nr:MerR family transcriptional regulator [Paenibacillus oryzae]OBR64226.1 MerR family transcriptional regulator [Paenibacillus oryzae]